MTKPLRCMLGIHNYIDIRKTGENLSDIVNTEIKNVRISKGYKLGSLVARKLPLRKYHYGKLGKKVIYDRVCPHCRKIDLKVSRTKKEMKQIIEECKEKCEAMVRNKDRAESIYKEVKDGIEM